MFNIKMSLREWRASRNITTPNAKLYVANIIEELLEIVHTDKRIIKHLQDEIMDRYFDFDNELVDENRLVDAINDIQVFSINECECMGFDNDLTMHETIKEIDSRLQDPTQREQWRTERPSGKWNKWREQPKDTLYTANYAQCRIL